MVSTTSENRKRNEEKSTGQEEAHFVCVCVCVCVCVYACARACVCVWCRSSLNESARHTVSTKVFLGRFIERKMTAARCLSHRVLVCARVFSKKNFPEKPQHRSTCRA